ncbi:unnamed protein product [Owenia fusiformis]|uniref:Uncharacterized protein n=1 Tax=Owenia fusiformis TaxID=6347 RepID=A0A8J1UCW1_OWEFU|nr:unnamed protein product [Owenia fusiformis]
MADGLKFLVLSFLAGFVFSVDVPPKWGSFYTVYGTLRLPYAELAEPFAAYYDSAAKKSRIDYYGTTVKTFQRADLGSFGVNNKVAFMSTDTVFNKRTCFQSNGTKDAPVTIQGVLPNLTDFKLIKKGDEVRFNDMSDMWQSINKVGTKKNTYTMWVKSDTQEPIRYEMMGYDTLLGSHYDKYYLDYQNFDNTNRPKPEIFAIQENLTCGGFPGPGVEHRVLSNPMQEYIHRDDSHTQTEFAHFKKYHNRQYVDKEHQERENAFRQNFRYVHSKNRAGLTYRLKVNHLADRFDHELKYTRGYRHTPGYHGGLAFNKDQYNLRDLPESVDWRLYGAVTPVKDQAVCGSCWSFGTTGTLEGQWFLKTGNLVRLSQQQLMDCSWGEGNNACDGGEDFRAYSYMMKNGGLATEDDYGPYMGQDGMCRSRNVTSTVKVTNYVNVTSGDEAALKMAIAKHGPISVAIDASHKSLSFYANGVYYEPECGNKPDDLDHAVLAVGYGTMNGQAYWLVKNSWSTYWGNDGYVLMSQKDNNCGVATDATFPLV